MSTLHAIGGLNGVGPEVFSVMNQGMSAEDVAQLCKQSLLAYPELCALAYTLSLPMGSAD